jgi:hypothetical protein
VAQAELTRDRVAVQAGARVGSVLGAGAMVGFPLLFLVAFLVLPEA